MREDVAHFMGCSKFPNAPRNGISDETIFPLISYSSLHRLQYFPSQSFIFQGELPL